MATVPDNRLRLRPMAKADIPALHALSRAEQWPHRADDLAAMLALGDGLIAEMGGQTVASVLWWSCGDAAATLGIVIVARTHRGAGLGRIIMEAALDALGDRSIILNATEEGLPLYRKLGFHGFGEILQHQGAAFDVPIMALADGERIRPLGNSDGDAVAALVERATGLHRPALIADLLDTASGVALDRDGVAIGIALFRRFGRGHSIGPVIAPDAGRAKILISHWLGSRSGEFTRLDIPGDCGLSAWLEDFGLVRVGRVVTMVRGTRPVPMEPGHNFAIVSQALG